MPHIAKVLLIAGMLYPPLAQAASPRECWQFGRRGDIRRPEAPMCNSTAFFSSGEEMRSCQTQLRTYHDDMDGYLKCLKAEGDSALSEYNDEVRKFNNSTIIR